MKRQLSSIVWPLATVLIALAMNSCERRKEKPEGPSAVLRRNSGIASESLETDSTIIYDGDTVVILRSERAQLNFGRNDLIHVRENSAIAVRFHRDNRGNGWVLQADILYGEVIPVISHDKSRRMRPVVTTPELSITTEEGAFDVAYYRRQNITILKTIAGDAILTPPNGENLLVPSCKKVMILNNGGLSKRLRLSESDIADISNWPKDKHIEQMARNAACSRQKDSAVNNPPGWRGNPRIRCLPDREFFDSLNAVDPDGDPVRYRLVKRPDGMFIDPESGIIQWSPVKSETHKIIAEAVDDKGGKITRQWYLTIVGNVNAVADIPSLLLTDEEFLVDASASVNHDGRSEGLRFRYDLDGDGKWDIPAESEFTTDSAVMHAFEKEGEYEIRVEVTNAMNQKAIAVSRVTVNAPPTAHLSVSPASATLGTVFNLNASESFDSGTRPSALSLRWDLDGDGTWDYPDDGSFAFEKTMIQIWLEPDTHMVSVLVKDAHGALDTASAKVIVTSDFQIDTLSCPDTVSVGESAVIACATSPKEVKIDQYVWSFGTSSPTLRTTSKPRTKLVFSQQGAYAVICRARNVWGLEKTAAKSVVVVDKAPELNAGGPYRVSVHDTLRFEPSIKHDGGTLVQYLWDFDNDSVYDWSSAYEPRTGHVFKTAGPHTVRFAAKNDNGTIFACTTVVAVVNTPPEVTARSHYVTSGGRRISLDPGVFDAENNVALIEWDFDNDGTFDWESKTHAKVSHVFREETNAVIRVIDTDGAVGTDTVEIRLCPDDMVVFPELHFCIDKHEWPNEDGSNPMREISREQAREECRKVGKRLCTPLEWKTACRDGKRMNEYPYGNKFNDRACNTINNRKVDNRAAECGEFADCRTRGGLYDMSGNVAEWVDGGSADSAHVYGGWWQSGRKESTCTSFMVIPETKGRLFVGFRCCK